MTELPIRSQISGVLVRLRSELMVTQAAVAQKAGIDQSRISRIEKGEVDTPSEVDRVLAALAELGSKDAPALKAFASVAWNHIEPPSFWNPQRAYLEAAEEILQRIQDFLQSDERPWPLKRQIERHRESLLRASTFLSRLNHNIAFIGDIGVGKLPRSAFSLTFSYRPRWLSVRFRGPCSNPVPAEQLSVRFTLTVDPNSASPFFR